MNETQGLERSGLASWLLAIRRDRKALIGACLLGAFTLIAVAGPWFVGDPRALVGIPLQPPSWAHPLGTNGQGQDGLAQLVVGTRVSLSLGFAVGLVVVVIGVLVGVPAGYFGGRTDGVLSVVSNVFIVLPGLLL
jgi:peptide/nickel transport system permease protein